MASTAGWYADPARPGEDRYWDGAAWVDEWRPSAVGPPPTYVTVAHENVGRTPGVVTAAFVLSLLGFCGITAVLGLVLAFAGLGQAHRNQAGRGLAIAAIIISFLWLAPGVAVIAIMNNSSHSAAPTSSPAPAQSGGTQSASASPASWGRGEKVVGILENRGFECEPPRGAMLLVQCRNGEVKVPVYGTQPAELVNIEMESQSISGYVYPATLKALKPAAVRSLGDAGDGTVEITE